MDTIKLKARAQNLDNRGSDIFFASGRGKIPEELHGCEEIAKDISAITYDGDLLDSVENIDVFYSESAFVLEVIGEERDVRGRLAPVSIFGRWPDAPDQDWCERVHSEIQTIFEVIGRTPPQTLDQVPDLLVEAAKKKKAAFQPTPKKIATLAGLTLMGLLAYLLYRNILGS